MITIIATITPYWARLIRIGRKQYEIRKSLPSLASEKGSKFRVLLCESGSGGKITGEFICDKWEWFDPRQVREETKAGRQLLKDACMSAPDLADYGKEHVALCAWHVSEVIDFCSTKGHHPKSIKDYGLKRAPQSWQYVKADED